MTQILKSKMQLICKYFNKYNSINNITFKNIFFSSAVVLSHNNQYLNKLHSFNYIIIRLPIILVVLKKLQILVSSSI